MSARLFTGFAESIQIGERTGRLTESDDCFRRLADHIPEVFWSIQLEPLKVLYISPAYEKVWGRPVATLLENPDSWMDAIVPEDRPGVELAVGRQSRGEESIDREYRIRRPDGSLRWIWSRGFPVLSASGGVNRVAGIAVDITERKNLEQELRHAQKMEAVGRLAGGVAHDFNNLLGIIMGCAEGAARLVSAEHPARTKLEQILRATDRAAEVTRHLLTFSRRESVSPHVVDLNAVLGDMEKMMRSLIGEDIGLALAADARASCLQADPGEIEQVVMNLIVNARDAMPHGGRLTIRTESVSRDEAGGVEGYVLLEIADSGSGIPEEVQAHMFEPFFTTKEAGKGTGLGLSTVYAIVTQARGRIFVHSVPGRGTTFRIYFPRVAAARSRAEAIPIAATPERGHETILLAEDDDVLRALIAEVLEDHGYRVLVAPDGASALRVAHDFGGRIDLLITDLVMPVISGAELARRITGHRPEIDVLYITGYTEEAIAGYGLSPRSALLAKPFGAGTLTAKVREMFGLLDSVPRLGAETPSACVESCAG